MKKILDLSQYIPGPYCSMLLGDLGFEVIKIEPINGENSRRIPPMFRSMNRNKKSIGIDLKSNEGKEIFYKLAENSDVIIESFRVGVVQRLGIDYETIKRMNEKIIYCSISGFGQTGYRKDLVAHNIDSLGYGGMLGISEKPPGAPIADLASGMFAAISILGAIISGNGKYIDISMLDSVISLMSPHLSGYFEDKKLKRRESMLIGDPLSYGILPANDGYFTLGIVEPKFWKILCERLNRPELLNDQFARGKRRAEVLSELNSIFEKLKRDEIISKLKDVPCSPVYNLEELIEDKNVWERKMLFEINGIKQISNPILQNFGNKPKKPPELGVNTFEVLKEIGYKKGEIEKFKKENIVR